MGFPNSSVKPDTDMENQLAEQLPNVKIFASNPYHDAFTSHFGTIWGLNVDGVLIKGTYYVVHFNTMCIKFLYILLNHLTCNQMPWPDCPSLVAGCL